MAEWSNAPDCKSGGESLRWFKSISPTASESSQNNRMIHDGNNYAVVAQLVEHQPSKLRVAGSIPVRRSDFSSCSTWANTPPVAYVAQSVEHVLGKDEVIGSIPVVGSLIICQPT